MAQMSNDIFIDKLLDSTKSGKITWEDGGNRQSISSTGSSVSEDLYYFEQSNKRIEIVNSHEEYNAFTSSDYYYLMISFSDKSIRPILFYANDFSTGSVLERLFRLAERSARKVDEVLSEIVSSLDGSGALF